MRLYLASAPNQCGQKLEGNATFETIKSNSDVIALLRLIRNFSYDIQSDRNPFIAQFMAIKNFVNLRQSFYMTNDQYLEAFTNNLQVLSHSGVDLGRNNYLRNILFKESGIDPSSSGTTEMANANKAAEDRFQAAAFLCGLNGSRYQSLIDDF